jgi:hypothetical protein
MNNLFTREQADTFIYKAHFSLSEYSLAYKKFKKHYIAYSLQKKMLAPRHFDCTNK